MICVAFLALHCTTDGLFEVYKIAVHLHTLNSKLGKLKWGLEMENAFLPRLEAFRDPSTLKPVLSEAFWPFKDVHIHM